MCSKFFIFYFIFALVAIPWSNEASNEFQSAKQLLVKKDERIQLVSTEYGEISAADIGDMVWGQHCHLQFITLEPNALFLPVLLHADMVFFVHSGRGRLSWADEDSMRHVKLRRGDVYRLRPGTIFYVQSNLENERQKLRIYTFFINPIDNQHKPSLGAYSSIRDLVLGFDKEVLQAAFQVPEEMIEELTGGTRQPTIVHAVSTENKEKSQREMDSRFIRALMGRSGYNSIFDVNKKSKTKAFNLYGQKPDFKNGYGQSLIVDKKNFHALKEPNLSIFMVNLTAGSMMGPHWNPMASEVSIVLQGEGIIRIVGPSTKNESNNSRYLVGEGDVFVVPRFHPMAQMAFTNNSFVFMGFSTNTKNNHPQFLSGKASALRTLNREIVAASFGVTNSSMVERFLEQQGESVILECGKCAEEELERERKEEEKRRQEEEERERKEEEKKRQEEERKREEEAKKRREEEARKEEEEAKRQEEERKQREKEEAEAEAKKRREEEARKEEEEAKRQEERKQREKEEAEAEAKKRREEEARKEEEEAKRQEEERKQREEEEAEAKAKKRREEEARKEEEEAKREEERRRQREEEEAEAEAKKRREEEARKEEEEAKRREEERQRREEEEAKKREEKEAEKRREEEARKEKEAAKRQEQEEESRKREEEEIRQQEKEEEERARREEEEQEREKEVEKAREKREAAARREQEEARRQEEMMKERQEQEAKRLEEEERARREDKEVVERARRQAEEEEEEA